MKSTVNSSLSVEREVMREMERKERVEMMEGMEQWRQLKADLWCEFYIIIVTGVIQHIPQLQILNDFKFDMVTTMTT